MKGGDPPPLNSRGPSHASSDRFEGGGLSGFTHECQSAFKMQQQYSKNERKKRGCGEEERERESGGGEQESGGARGASEQRGLRCNAAGGAVPAAEQFFKSILLLCSSEGTRFLCRNKD